MRWIFAALALAATTAAARPLPYPRYGATELQKKVDLSFSSIPITTPFAKVRKLLRWASSDCKIGECERRDAAGVHYSFWDDELFLKSVSTADFRGRPIGALGIGLARTKTDVIARIKAFDRRIKLDCEPAHISNNVGPLECNATLGPGWIAIGFDKQGQLLMIRFDGYHAV